MTTYLIGAIPTNSCSMSQSLPINTLAKSLALIFTLSMELFFIKSYKPTLISVNLFSLNFHQLDHLLHSSLYIKFPLQILIITFIFVEYQCYGIPYPKIDIHLSPAIIKNLLIHYYWSHFLYNFKSNNICTFYFCCPCSSCTILTRPTPYPSL